MQGKEFDEFFETENLIDDFTGNMVTFDVVVKKCPRSVLITYCSCFGCVGRPTHPGRIHLTEGGEIEKLRKRKETVQRQVITPNLASLSNGLIRYDTIRKKSLT